MKNTIFLSVLLVIFSCNKKETISSSETTKIDSTKIIDSINVIRNKINDSIRNKNYFDDLSGSHSLTHNAIHQKGFVDFKKVSGDEYEVNGSIKKESNYLKINGIALRVSDKHFNFTGTIVQSISENDHGKIYTRKGTKTFLSKDGGKTWRLQDMINSSGFVDYIDIKL